MSERAEKLSPWRRIQGERVKAKADARALEASTEMARKVPDLENQAITDPLTGLLNRRGFLPYVEDAIRRLERHKNAKPVSIIYLDIDDFKKINTEYGHEGGDKVLKEIGGSLKEHVRGADKVGRLGGEELCILLEEANQENAHMRAEHLRNMIRSLKISTRNGPLSVTVSLGIASMSSNDDFNTETLINHANLAMLKAKEAGKNRTVLYQQ